MDANALAEGAALPLFAQGAGLAVLCLILLFSLSKCHSPSARFLIIVIWARFVLSAFHNLTFVKILPGLSINSISSVAVVAIGLVMIKRRSLFNLMTIVILPYLVVLAVSAMVNKLLVSSIDDIIKIMYLIIIVSHVHEIVVFEDYKKFSNYVLLSFSPLIVYQLISIVLGVKKAGESDGSVSYIGGYNHEAAFSVGLMGMIVAAALGEGIPTIKRIGVLILGIIGILLANYRTTILASSPIIIFMLGSAVISTLPRHLRGIFLISGGISAVLLLSAAISTSDRLADLPAAVELVSSGISSPDTITGEQKKLLSGRLYLWSEYIYQWRISDSVHQLFGFGPGSWEKYFPIYAHNTFVNGIFELGIFGLICLFIIFLSAALIGLSTYRSYTIKLLLAQLSFFILNLSTMPMWQIEGLIAFALILGWSVAHFSARKYFEAALSRERVLASSKRPQ